MPTRTNILTLIVGLAIIGLASVGQSQAQQPADSKPSPSGSTDFWKATNEVIDKRERASQPLVQPRPAAMNLDRACYAAQVEMARRGIVADLDPHPGPHFRLHADAKPGTHFNFSDAASSPHDNSPSSHDSKQPDSIPQPNPLVSEPETVTVPSDTYLEPVSDAIDQIHANCFEDTEFPSAAQCQRCHPGHYEEWSVSPHAYAQLSPVFNAMSSKLNTLTNGTLGDFCIRCHTPVGMARNEPIIMPNADRYPAAREGVTCVVCHRINQNWGKVSGRQALVGGGLEGPVYGPHGNETLEIVLANPDEYGVLAPGKIPGVKSRNIHRESVPFFALTTPSLCGSCHDVFAPNGFRLEDAFSEFKRSPAARNQGRTCQDCHMGISPGEASGFSCEPAAQVGNAFTPPRKRTNHMMIGPDYSIVHPGIFPHNPQAVREEFAPDDTVQLGLATIRQWLEFDDLAGWGTPEFERHVDADYPFPESWNSPARRYRARDILNEQYQLLHRASLARHQLLSVGYRLGNIVYEGKNRKGLHFKIKVSNGTDGHGVPTGFDAERLVFLRTTVTDRFGRIVLMSGDLDPNGDVRDSHSFYVNNGKLPLDRQLFSLQTKFLTRNLLGGEREQILNIAYSLDPLPYIRPEVRPFTVLGRPVEARKHKQNIEIGGHRWASYTVPQSHLTGCGPYDVNVQLVAAMVPVNLVQEISSAGFDYGMSAREIADAIVAGHVIVHTRDATLKVDE